MLLGPGESLLRSAYAVATGNDDAGGPEGAGVLYLTNQRVLFESPVGRAGVGRRRGRETEVRFEVALHDLRNVTVRRPRIGRPRLVLEVHHARPAFDVLEPEAWMTMVAQARRALPAPGVAVVREVHTVERQVVKVRCRYCAALANEVDGRCPSCGAPL